jgi:hypothetical protein
MSAQLAINFDRRSRTPYWPTTPLPIAQLADAIKRAEQQDEAVLAIFRSVGGSLTPSQVQSIGVGNGLHWLLTSVRRSMTNLTNAGVLVHLHDTRPGPHGRPEGLWQVSA